MKVRENIVEISVPPEIKRAFRRLVTREDRRQAKAKGEPYSGQFPVSGTLTRYFTSLLRPDPNDPHSLPRAEDVRKECLEFLGEDFLVGMEQFMGVFSNGQNLVHRDYAAMRLLDGMLRKERTIYQDRLRR